MQKNLIKFGAGIVGLVAVGAAVFYGVQWYQEQKSPEYAMMREYEKLMEAYKNDTYGGDTPEETLRLFIDALKAGDTDLAAKYFIQDYQTELVERLSRIENNGNLDAMVSDVSRFSNGSAPSEGKYQFVVLKKDTSDVAEFTIGLIRNEVTGKWKLDKFF